MVELFIVFALGLCVGSFLNVVVFRTRSGSSFVKGRSRCLSCETSLRPLDMIPVFSFFLLRAKCRTCDARISLQYPLVEFLTGMLFLIFWTRAIGSTFFVRDAIAICFLVVIFLYDLRFMQILDRFTIPATILAVLFNLALGMDALDILLGAVVMGGFFLAQLLLSRGRWIGGGDVRLGLFMGALLGLSQGLVALFVAYLLGAVIAVFLLCTGRAGMKTPLPFGTFLSVATIVTLLFGTHILSWYIGLF